MQPLNIAIIGAGPSGLYAASDLLKQSQNTYVDLFDRLPVLGGLARYGVSPDHAMRRKVVEYYEAQIVASGRYRFLGNVEVGRDVGHDELLGHYHAIIYASGAAKDRSLNLPGEALPGSVAATDFVAWYNGHPDHAKDAYDLSVSRAVVIGNGNVALDVARMLLLGREQLEATDVANTALQALSESNVDEVVMLGRRGPPQASFTLPELLELENLPEIDVLVESPAELLSGNGLDVTRSMRMDVLRRLSKRAAVPGNKRLILRFLHSPVKVLGNDRVTGIEVQKNILVGDRAEATEQISVIDAGLVIRAVGYQAQPLDGLPFDAKSCVIPNQQGRVFDPEGDSVIPGVFVAGWLKRGPRGVIGSNKLCSKETVASITQDFKQGLLNIPEKVPSQLYEALVQRGVRRVDSRAWHAIDRMEREVGKSAGRPRVKLCNFESLLAAAGI